MRSHQLLLITTLATSLAAINAHAAPTGYYDIVRSAHNQPVTTYTGSCVRTKWFVPGTECDVQVAGGPTYRTARSLAKEERTVYFDFDRYNIRPSEQPKLEALAQILKSDKEVRRVNIVGYADRYGSVDYNDRLSQRRAKSVENYLHQQGYMNTALAQTRWLGETAPVTRCPTTLPRKEQIACLQPDRRVEAEIEFVNKTTVVTPN